MTKARLIAPLLLLLSEWVGAQACQGVTTNEFQAEAIRNGSFTCDDLLKIQQKQAARDKELAEKKAAWDKEGKELEAAIALKNSITNLENGELCSRYGEAVRDDDLQVKEVLKEMTRRKLAVNASKVKRRTIAIGDGLCQLFAAWGMPDDSNRTVSADGVRVQWVYRPRKYVYTVNGRITAWQD